MFSKIINPFRSYSLLAILTAGLLASCTPDESGIGNGLTDPDVDASFTVKPVDGDPNSFVLQSTNDNVLRFMWNIGDGFYNAPATDTIFLPDAGTYTASQRVIGRGGAVNIATQEIEVATSDPAAGNIIQGGKFENQAAQEHWTVLNISESGANWSFNDGFATITASDFNQQGIFQAVEVEANKEYTIDMRVFGSGATNTWFEAYVSPEPPVQNSDYAADGRRIALSTYDGCGNSEFDGRISQLGCVGSGNTVSFEQSGTVYFLIKSGGESTGSTGISVTNIEMRGKRE
ncbi:hypothetical protein [Flavimarina sp. Hel_I_48]|uniref:hypothetical protein n=1 Tax=Flavimarina sp. Hel_I_48 TaxID=1392488 RepID=UPI0004DF45B6|nr:hypothetical protein [Flavimarina sp. Hel_I_48]